ncbi:MAG: sigma-70 family RNA polymerase sigma factor [Planctomycetota bacterium]|nr:MAG: sigma-70 family RNA polymerase sigma factor [Planctomycetota bacterium]
MHGHVGRVGGLGVAVSDGTLVLGVLRGDRSAFAELYDRRARLVRALCYDATRDLDAAADLTQEVFLRAYRDLGRLRDPDKFTPWLVGIARQVCREWRRSRRRERERLCELARVRQGEGATAPPPGDELSDLREAIARATSRGSRAGSSLTEKERLALHAFYLQGRSAEEARNVLGLSRSGFYRVLSRACERLRQMLCTQEVQP